MHNSILWSVMAGACTFLGAAMLLARRHWGRTSLAFFLGLASGVMGAVILFDLLPSVLFFPGRLKGLVGFLLTIPFMMAVNSQLKIDSAGSLIRVGYLIMLGIALHDLPEGMAIAFGDEMKRTTGLVIALGIGIHNIPEGMAMAAPLLMAGVRKSRVLAMTFIVGLITPLGTLLGKYAAAVFPELLPLMLGLAAGIMFYLVVFQLWPQAAANRLKSRWWGFFLGMIIIFAATMMI